jgi:hypothetical protein
MSALRPLNLTGLSGEREVLQKGLKGRSPNCGVRDIHVTVAVWASWNQHRSVVRCGRHAQELRRVGQAASALLGCHRYDSGGNQTGIG